jgi:D-alanyl-D-alanine carboxypeptidase/D-alanyl-D-alanine-endopeptidase (penicillin-binding protein 4)
MPNRAGDVSVSARPARVWRGVALGIFLAAVSHASGQSLSDEIDRAIAGSKLGTARIGISVVDASSGRVLAQRNDQEAFIPASNMKLLTSGAALLVLGEDFAFRTEFRRDGGRLVVVGGGDPALADPELLARLSPPVTVEDVVGKVVEAAAKSGAAEFTEIVVDDRVFDREFVHPQWPVDQLNRWYCAEVAGINFHTNTLSVFPRPGREGVGRPPEITTEPAGDWIEISAGTSKTASGGTTNVWLTRAVDANRFQLHGKVATAVKEPVLVTLHDPPDFFGRMLSDRLDKRGIRCGPVRRASDGDVFGGEVIAVATTHIDDILARCNADSYNLYAEALLKRMGRDVSGEPGSWSNGAAVVRMMITQTVGAGAGTGTVISDGSGMSRQNRLTPRLMTSWLAALQKRAGIGEAFLASLAGAGESTLRNRFEQRAPENTLQAKTGYIKGVRALSGFLTSPETGRRVAFSILINDLKGEHDAAGKRVQETIVLLIDAWLTEQAAEFAGAEER